MKKRVIVIFSIIIVVLLFIIGWTFIGRNKKSELIMGEDFIRVDLQEEVSEPEDFKVFTNYEEYQSVFTESELTEEDFKYYNYVLITLCVSCSTISPTPSSYTIEENKINILVRYIADCGVCTPAHVYYLLKIDKDIITPEIDTQYEAINKINCSKYETEDKPLIYLYPEEEMNITVKLGYPELLTTTYPKYNKEWNVLAKPNGELTDEANRTYYGLYWESLSTIKDEFTDGFIVKGEDVVNFLEEKLSILGLNEREANEFIIYWLPKLENSKYNFIRFASIEEINSQMPLSITPTPDTLIRVLMEYKPLEQMIDVKEQKLESINRKGYTVVEWGGTKLS